MWRTSWVRRLTLPERAAASGIRFSAVAENIGVSANAVEMQDLWAHSVDHRENMLNPAVNAVGIAVRQLGGKLWAVEDFASTSTALSLLDQEDLVSRLLRNGGLRSTGTENARAMCRMSSGYVGKRPDFVMRFNATELTHLPAQLEARMRRGGLSSAAVGACDYPRGSFASYSNRGGAIPLAPQSYFAASSPAASNSSVVAGLVASICSRSLARLK